MIKRIIKFNLKDWEHIWWLFKNMIKQFAKGDYAESYDAWMWIRVHLSYDSFRKDE